ncbi:MAG: hypothetical protein NUV90_03055 [Candidatus Parcubacteria bacterium]|nr:hypothetical protein [Candidatus Parcubacteria bacterium]
MQMPPLGQIWKWVLAVAVLLAVGWLWFSWRSGTFLDTPGFPFGEQGVYTPAPTDEEVIDSLSVPSTTEGTASSTPAAPLESLSPAASAPQTGASNADNPAVDSSVLDSLSAPN